jgi:hypothetical protein
VTRQAVITPEGLEKLKEEIDYLATAKRREVAERIKEAREFGDISENAEYDDAKNEQAMLEARIAQLEERLRRATVIDEKGIGTDEVAEVPDRRLDRGRPARAQALQRVADRQSPARPPAQRRGHGRGAAGPEEEIQNHQDRDRIAVE